MLGLNKIVEYQWSALTVTKVGSDGTVLCDSGYKNQDSESLPQQDSSLQEESVQGPSISPTSPTASLPSTDSLSQSSQVIIYNWLDTSLELES